MDDGLGGFSEDHTGNRIDRVINEITSRLPIEDKGVPRSYLGMSLTFKNNIVFANQPNLIDQISILMNCRDCNTISTPLRFGVNIPKNTGDIHPGWFGVSYNRIIGMMNFLSCCTRLDITNAIRVLASHTAKPSKQAWLELHHCAQYLETTKDWGITFGLNSPFLLPDLEMNTTTSQPYLTTFCDSDHASEQVNRVSISGYISLFNGSPINWNSKKQTGTIALSSMEAEVVAACHGIKDAIWMRKIWNKLEGSDWSINVGLDNQAAIYFGQADADHTRVKHIDLQYHFIKAAIQAKLIQLWYCPSKYNPADLFTKSLRSDRHLIIMLLIGLRSYNSLFADARGEEVC